MSGAREGNALPWMLGLPVFLWQIVFFAAPLGFLVVITFWQVRSFRLEPAFVFDNWERVLNSIAFNRALVYTLEVAALTTVLAVLLAFPAAYTVSFQLSQRWRQMIMAALIVPVFSSYLLRVYAWQIVLSPEGIINAIGSAAGLPALPLLGNAFSLQLGLLTLTLPVVTLILVFGMNGVDRTLIKAAENLGCSRRRAVFAVLIPSIRPAIFLAAVTAFLLSFGDYVSPVFLTGSNPPTLSIVLVDTIKSGSQWPRASVVGVSMLVILMVVFVVAQLASGRQR